MTIPPFEAMSSTTIWPMLPVYSTSGPSRATSSSVPGVVRPDDQVADRRRQAAGKEHIRRGWEHRQVFTGPGE